MQRLPRNVEGDGRAVLANAHFDERIRVVGIDIRTRTRAGTQSIANRVFHLQGGELSVAQLGVDAVSAHRQLRPRSDDLLPRQVVRARVHKIGIACVHTTDDRRHARGDSQP